MPTKTDQLREIRDAVIALEGSALADTRRVGGWLPVLGEGSHDANILFTPLSRLDLDSGF